VRLRIGIDTGPVVAGVIGRRRFSYDLWGDTVNTASRMETTGVPGCIQITERIRELLGDCYVLRERGRIQVRGKGKMLTYFLSGRTREHDHTTRTGQSPTRSCRSTQALRAHSPRLPGVAVRPGRVRLMGPLGGSGAAAPSGSGRVGSSIAEWS
jgi:hypothetical protein